MTENIDRHNKCRNIGYSIISWKVIGYVLKFRYLYQPLCNSFIYACSVTVFRAQVLLSYFEKWQALCSLTCNNLLCSGANPLSRNIPELAVIVVRMKSRFKGRLHFYRLYSVYYKTERVFEAALVCIYTGLDFLCCNEQF